MYSLDDRRVKVPKNFDISKARKAQQLIASKTIEVDELPRQLTYIAGADAAFRKGRVIGAIVVLRYRDWKAAEESSVVLEERFPYIPTLLSFREAPVIFAAFSKLKVKPQLMFIDGQGLAHPYRCGLATHIGVVLDLPTIGVAKKRLWGEEGALEGNRAPLIDPRDGKVIGAAVWTKKGSRPVYVSIGHKISLETAVRLVLEATLPGKRLPEPILAAHALASKMAKEVAE
ncbi:MAG: endonuclease V [Thermoprotei archaeon]|nr:MAG: endonuclease V [Thermoprotei archaeon]